MEKFQSCLSYITKQSEKSIFTKTYLEKVKVMAHDMFFVVVVAFSVNLMYLKADVSYRRIFASKREKWN